MKHLALGIMFAIAFVLFCADSASWAWFVASKLAGAGCMLALVFVVNSVNYPTLKGGACNCTPPQLLRRAFGINMRYDRRIDYYVL